MTELSTHRLLQISVLSDSCTGERAQLIRAAHNAKTINANGFRRFALLRARRLARINRACGRILSHAEWARRRGGCLSRVEVELVRRPGNALNIEIGAPATRCLSKQPRSWAGRKASSLAWVASGGSALVFGACSANCPQGY